MTYLWAKTRQAVSSITEATHFPNLRLLCCLTYYLTLLQITSLSVWAQDHKELKSGAIISLKKVDQKLGHEFWRIAQRVNHGEQGVFNVTAIANAPQQELWLGTPSGLIRYDGMSFETIDLEANFGAQSTHQLDRQPSGQNSVASSSNPLQTVKPKQTRLTTVSEITSLVELLPSHDLLIGIQGQGVWRYHTKSYDKHRSRLTRVSASTFQHITPFSLSVKGNLLYIAGTHGLSVRNLKKGAVSNDERLILSDAVFDLAWVDKGNDSVSAYTCGERGLAYVNDYEGVAKLIFSRTDEGKTCRGITALPPGDDHEGEAGHFALFEDRVYYIESQQVFRVASPGFKSNWGQKPFIDQGGQLWIPTQKALLRYGHYQDIRHAALQGEFVHPQESLAIVNSKALHQLNPQSRSLGVSDAIWLTNPEQRLLKITRSQGELLLPKSLKSSGAGPIIRTQKQPTSSRLWWVESCNKIYTAQYSWSSSANHSKVSQFNALQSLHLPRRKDGECVDAMAGLDEPNSPLVIARRNEVWALDTQDEVSNKQEPSSFKVKLRQLWSRPCDSLDCRMSALHIHSVQPLVVFAGTESGQVFRLSEQAEPQLLAVKSTEQHAAIKVIKESRHGLLVGHAQGLSILKLDHDFNLSGELDLRDLPNLPLSRSPIRDLYKDHDHQIWWVASYGDGLAWLDLSDIQHPKSGRFNRLLKGANRFLSGLIEMVDAQNQKMLWIQSNQGLIRLPVSKLVAQIYNGMSHELELDETLLDLISLDEANGWLRPSFTHLGPILVAATTQQSETVDTRSLDLSTVTMPPKFVSATWYGSVQGQNLVEIQEIKASAVKQGPSTILHQEEPQSKETNALEESSTVLAPEGANALELALAHPLGVNQPIQSLLYRMRRWEDKQKGLWNKIRSTNRLSFAHMKPGQYKLELKSIRNGQESKVRRQIDLVIPEAYPSAEQQWFWSLIFFSLGSGLLVSSLFYRENRSLKVEAKTHEIESKQNKNFLNHYKSVFEQSGHALLLFSEQGSCLEWNPKALELFGLTAQEMYYVIPQELGLRLPKLDEDFSHYRDLSLLCKRPFGNGFPARVSMSLHAQRFGHYQSKQYILISVIDLSSLVKTQDQQLKEQSKVSQLKRLESLGRLAGSVAHEMNNTFGELEGLLEAFEEELSQFNYDSERLNLLKKVSQKGHQYVQHLLNVTNRHPQLTQFNLQEQSYQKQAFAYRPVTQLFEEELKHLSWLLSQEQSLEFEYLQEPIEDDDLLGRAFDHDDKVSATQIKPRRYLIHKPLYDHFTFRLILLLSEKMTSRAQLKIQQGLSYGNTLIFRVSLAHDDYISMEQDPWAIHNGIFDEQLTQLKLQLETLGAYLTQEFTPSSSSVSLRFPLLERDKIDSVQEEYDQLSKELQELINILDDLHEPNTIDAYPTLESEQRPTKRGKVLASENQAQDTNNERIFFPSKSKSLAQDQEQIRARVLLVDDNKTLLKILTSRLNRKNFEVYAFAESRQAQVFIESSPPTDFDVDVLVTDVLMPHINGRQLADRFQALYPHLPVVFISAYTDDVLSPDGQFALGENEFFMRKPFSPKELIKYLSEVLTASIPDVHEHVSEPRG